MSEPVMRGCTTRRWPLPSRSTACLARRLTSSTVLPLRVRSRRGLETRRSTSLFASRARAILWPSSRGASSRTIVSTSGSSGMLPPLPLPVAPRDLAPADVPAVGLPLERDQLARVGALLRGVRHGVAQPRHREHAPAVHPQRAVGGGVAVGARVEHERPRLHVARHDDGRAQLRLVGIAGRREHGGHRRARRREGALRGRSEEHTSELQSLAYLVCRLLLEKKKTISTISFADCRTGTQL